MSKPELRALARQRLQGLTASQRDAAGEAIAARMRALSEFQGAETILLFASLPDEVSTRPLARAIRAEGRRLAYPRAAAGGRLVLHLVKDASEMAPGRYGISEPGANLPMVSLEEVDLALAPGLAWDRAGGRLGRGGGYFDRLYAARGWRGFICGVFHSVQEVEQVPLDPWDVPLGAVVTEKELWRPRPLGGSST